MVTLNRGTLGWALLKTLAILGLLNHGVDFKLIAVSAIEATVVRNLTPEDATDYTYV